MWSKIHERHSSRDIDLSIIDEFLGMDKLERYYIQTKKHQMKSTRTAKHLMEDVTDEDTFNHAITMELSEDVTVKKFMQDWMHMGDRRDPIEGTNKADIMSGEFFKVRELLVKLSHATVCYLVIGNGKCVISTRRDLLKNSGLYQPQSNR